MNLLPDCKCFQFACVLPIFMKSKNKVLSKTLEEKHKTKRVRYNVSMNPGSRRQEKDKVDTA